LDLGQRCLVSLAAKPNFLPHCVLDLVERLSGLLLAISELTFVIPVGLINLRHLWVRISVSFLGAWVATSVVLILVASLVVVVFLPVADMAVSEGSEL